MYVGYVGLVECVNEIVVQHGIRLRAVKPWALWDMQWPCRRWRCEHGQSMAMVVSIRARRDETRRDETRRDETSGGICREPNCQLRTSDRWLGGSLVRAERNATQCNDRRRPSGGGFGASWSLRKPASGGAVVEAQRNEFPSRCRCI